MVAGNVDMMITQPSSTAFVTSGRLRALAIISPRRSPSWPDVPTVSEAGLTGYESQAWYGLVAPRNLPADVLKKLSDETVRVLRTKELKENLAASGGDPIGSSPAEFTAFIKAEINRYASVVRDAGISAE